MSDASLLQAAESLVTEPTFGIPLLVTASLLVLWIIATPAAGERRPPALRRSWFEPAEDLPSRIYYALADGQYSRVRDATAGKLDEVVYAKRGVSVYQLPFRRTQAERIGVPEAPELKRALRGLSRAHAEAIDRESTFFIRWRFWRTPADDRADFLERVEDAVSDAAYWIRQLEGAA